MNIISREFQATSIFLAMREAGAERSHHNTKGCNVNHRFNRLISSAALAFAIMACQDSAFADESIITLGCVGKLYTKHYDEEADANAVIRINPSARQVTVTTLEQVGVVGADNSITWKSEEQKDAYTISLDSSDFLSFSRSIYDDKYIVSKPTPDGGVMIIPVEKDDTATGSLNKLTGTLIITTKYYASKVETVDSPLSWLIPPSPPRHEFGWKLTMTCQSK
jgi:hypothetical protein